MPRQYPLGFRDELVQRMLGAEPILVVRDDGGIHKQTLHRWKKQGLIDAGVKDGVDSRESAALRSANKRTKALEKNYSWSRMLKRFMTLWWWTQKEAGFCGKARIAWSFITEFNSSCWG